MPAAPVPPDVTLRDAGLRAFGDEELDLLRKVLQSGQLNCTGGWAVRQLEQAFASLHGVERALACSSGTAAVHAAVAALDPEPGEEIVTSPLTDFGAIGPILQQGAIPVFADVDPRTGLITPETARARIGSRTRAIVATHLLGQPADVEGLAGLGLPVVEDCAQAPLAALPGGPAGTRGAIGCFSLQQTKHVTTGEGGLLLSRDERLMRRMHAFVNKARDYDDPLPDHHFLAGNHRMTELQGAVGIAQVGRLAAVVERRRLLAARFAQVLDRVPGLTTSASGGAAGRGSHWKVAVSLHDHARRDGAAEVAARLAAQGIPAIAPLQQPAYRWGVFRHQRTFGASRYPFTLARPEALDDAPERFPGVAAHLANTIVLPWDERLSLSAAEELAGAVASACSC